MSYLTDNKELRDLIINNPNLPLLFFATEDANNGDYYATTCDVNCYVGYVLDCDIDVPIQEKIYMDRDDLEEDIVDLLWDRFSTMKEFEKNVRQELAKYEPYWKKAIIVICG